MKKKICILNTGGTIGMIRTPSGYAPSRGYILTALDNIAELRDERMPETEVIELDPLLDSSNMSVESWSSIIGYIGRLYDDYDGFVILHGTDTMAYTASALAFALENLGKPVILTGSQIPLCEIRSDGKDNVISAVMIAASGMVREVSLFFGGKLFRGCRVTKISTDDLIAFDSPNYPPLATAGIEIKYNRPALRKAPAAGFGTCVLKDVPIGVLKFFPGMQFGIFESIMTEKLRGVVIEAFGAGNIPSDDSVLPGIIRKAFDNGTIVTVCSQCLQGTVLLGQYATSTPLKKAGAVSGRDMTTEAAVTKLYYLFSKGYDKETVKELMETDLRGELTGDRS